MTKKEKFTEKDEALLTELGIAIDSNNVPKFTTKEHRIIAGFEEIQKFVVEHGRLPDHGENKDIFERLYAVRLDRIRSQKQCLELLESFDSHDLLNTKSNSQLSIPENIEDEELLRQLGIDDESEKSITNLKHVKSQAEKRAVEEIANRTRCENFEQYKALFDRIKKEIDSGHRDTVRFRKDAGFTKTTLKRAQFIIVGGQIALIAEIGESFKAPNGEEDARLRVIYSNGMESNILLRSLIRAMYKDEASRFITDPSLGPLFSSEKSSDDQESGTIYVLRSLSDNPLIQENKSIVHKIGVTGGDVKIRIANSKNDPTFLMSDVEIVATYRLANINRVKLENIIHKFFDSAKLEIDVKDRFGKPVKVREWFLVPLFIIDEMVSKIKDGTISDYYYDPTLAKLKR